MVRKKLSWTLVIVWAGVLVGLSLSARVAAVSADSKSAGQQTQQSQAASSASKEKTAAEQFKNIQILKDIPASQLIESMQFISAALGVSCDYCHVNPFSEDTKREKQTARKMMLMVKAINDQAFNGRSEVNCATCHQGHNEPRSFPPLAAGFVDVAPAKAEGQLPTADQILDKYVEALGGKAALDKLTSRESKGTLEVPDRGTITVDIYQKSPNKVYESEVMQGGATMIAGYDGTAGWHKTTGEHGRLQMVTGVQLDELQRDSELVPALNVKSQYQRLVVAGKGKIGDEDVYGLVAFTPGKGGVRLFFDTNSGLLVRRFSAPRTPLGPLPSVEDFSDYRDVDGVKVPFTIKLTGPRNTTVEKLTEVKHNVSIADSKFAPPSQ